MKPGDLYLGLLATTEADRARLARELHGELGGLLIATRIDVSLLVRQVATDDPDFRQRAQRIQAALDAAIDLKRRLVEELRPSLLDNMGLAAALGWQAEETCSAAGIDLRLELPEQEPALGPDAAIALFRFGQEVLAEIVRQGQARAIRVGMCGDGACLKLVIEHDGARRAAAPDSHRLSMPGMDLRLRALGGSLSVEMAQPPGLRVVAAVPLRDDAPADIDQAGAVPRSSTSTCGN